MTQPAVLHTWYAVPAPPVVGTCLFLFVVLVLILSAFLVDPDRRKFCPVHKAQGLLVGIKAAPCPLCLFPEVRR